MSTALLAGTQVGLSAVQTGIQAADGADATAQAATATAIMHEQREKQLYEMVSTGGDGITTHMAKAQEKMAG